MNAVLLLDKVMDSKGCLAMDKSFSWNGAVNVCEDDFKSWPRRIVDFAVFFM